MPTHTRATALALLAAAGLGITACSSSTSPGSPGFSGKPAVATTTTSVYDPQLWKARITSLVADLDQAQPGCTAHPASSDCATALRDADSKILAMNQAITDSGSAAKYPATVDHIQRNILPGYNAYVNAGCGSDDPSMDGDCRSPMVQVMLAVATLPSKMTVDS